MNNRINVTRSSMPLFDEYINEISSLWESRWLTNMGIKHNELEQKLKEYLKAENITLFTNGHLALEGIISALELKGEIITTPFTFVSTTQAIIRCGLTPVFCDIKESDYTIDAKKIERLITEKTSAILPVHVYGNPCDVDLIDKLADKYKLKVIYDAAHSFGVTLNDIPLSDFGDASMFSFHATKVFNTIEGGAIVCKDENIPKRLDKIKNFGIANDECVDSIGGNAKMNEFQAAMGLCNLRYIDNEILKRKNVYERYINNLSDIDGIKLNIVKQKVKSNYAYFPVVFESFRKTRNEIYEQLKNANIFARKYFYPLTNNFKYSNNEYINNTPVAQRISENILTLPMYADLDLSDVDKICEIIIK